MAAFDLDRQVALVPRTTNRVHVPTVTLDAATGTITWLAFDNALVQGEGRRYSAQLTGPQLAAVANIIKSTMAADLGAIIT